ncbi:hypothetical protein PV327_011131 [Microctonus hyperodae]|uniref:Uncharacterized protein n=1 Tax=Microctonus hyperodae TaxID=165561 RepID=A0AA39KUJ5_MICHY|nr:hypothetical protein PV327_011131 [Microctonus hyperodae]
MIVTLLGLIKRKYNRSLQTDSSFAAYSIAGVVQYAKILYYVKISLCECIPDKCLCEGKHFVMIRPKAVIQNFLFHVVSDEIHNPHIFHCTFLKDVATIPLESLITVCFAISHDEKLYLARRINTH